MAEDRPDDQTGLSHVDSQGRLSMVDVSPKAVTRRQGVARGRVDFEQLPNGAWVIRRWWIRMPLGRIPLAVGIAARIDHEVGERRLAGEVRMVANVVGEPKLGPWFDGHRWHRVER